MKERLTTYVIALPATYHTHTNTPSLLQDCESKKKKKKKKKKRKKNDNTKRGVKLNYNNDNNLPASNSSTKNKKIEVLDATDNPFSQFVYKGCLSNSYFKTTEKEGPDDALKVKKTTTQTVKLSHYFSNHPDKQNSVAEEEEEEAALVVCKKQKLSAQQKACFPNPVSDQGISKKGNSTAVEEEEEAVVVCKKTKKRKRSGRQKVCFSNPVSDQGISKKGDSVVDEAVASTSGSHATEKVKAKEEVVVCKKQKKDKHCARQKVCISNPVTDSGDQEISQAENSAGVKVSHYFSTEKHVACKKNDSHSTVKFVSPYFPRKANEEEEEEEEVVVVCKKKKKDNLTARQKRDDAYKKKTPDNTWKPPRSHHNLIQEDHIHDPWRIVVICILLNMTQGVQVRGVISEFFSLCPDAKTATEVPAEAIEKLITPLGLQKVKTERIQRFSEGYLWDDWTHITQLHGVGKYAADAYAIFVTGQWRRVIPADHMLNRYWEFLHQNAHYWTN